MVLGRSQIRRMGMIVRGFGAFCLAVACLGTASLAAPPRPPEPADEAAPAESCARKAARGARQAPSRNGGLVLRSRSIRVRRSRRTR